MAIRQAKYILDDYPEDFPPKKYFIDQHWVTQQQFEEFKSLIEDGAGEREIDRFIKKNLSILSTALSFFRTGHHGSWIIPQQDIKPSTEYPGLKPDYLIGGKNSDGFSWSVIDLKGAGAPIFSTKGKRVHFSTETNKGVFQVLEYMSYCSRYQSFMRESLKLVNLTQPMGILIIGRECELLDDRRRMDLRADWNRLTNGNLHVRTYDALLRAIEQLITNKVSKKTSQ